MDATLDALFRDLKEGHPEYREDHRALSEVMRSDREPDVRALAAEAVRRIEANGHLGLRWQLTTYARERAALRRAALSHQIRGEEPK